MGLVNKVVPYDSLEREGYGGHKRFLNTALWQFAASSQLLMQKLMDSREFKNYLETQLYSLLFDRRRRRGAKSLERKNVVRILKYPWLP